MRLFVIGFVLLIFFMSSPLAAEESVVQHNAGVFSKLGNIYFTPDNGHPVQITFSRKDSSPILSPNKIMIAFIRTGEQIIPNECSGDTESKYGNQVWIYNLLTKKEHLIVKNNFNCNKPEEQIIDPANLSFSPDNKLIYFITSAWTTSGALHSVRITDAKLRYIAPAHTFSVVTKGENKGYLIVYQHRYFIGGGTYDWYWLIAPNGKEEGPLGPEITKEQMDFIESDA